MLPYIKYIITSRTNGSITTDLRENIAKWVMPDKVG